MRLLLHNGSTGRCEEFRPAAAPRCVLRWGWPDGPDLGAFRRAAFRSCLLAGLDYLGFVIDESGAEPDLVCGPAAGETSARLELAGVAPGAPMPAEVFAKGFDPLDLRLLCLRVHYRAPWIFDWERLEAARGERQGLLEAAGRLRERAGASAPNPTGLAGYKKRFRDALSADLDFPKAIGALWDALRPGALSPGSQWAALDEADRVLGLLRLG